MIIPWVTDVLVIAGVVDFGNAPDWALMRARRRGKVVDAACLAFDKGEPVNPNVKEFLNYLHAWREFKRDHKVEIESFGEEIRGECNGLRFVGYCDRIAVIDGRRTMLDIKSTYKPSKSWPLQLSAYALGKWGENYSLDKYRANVHLKKEGKYKLVWQENPEDDQKWVEALTKAHRMIESGEAKMNKTFS